MTDGKEVSWSARERLRQRIIRAAPAIWSKAVEACLDIADEMVAEKTEELREALEWIETYIANQPLDSLAQFLITKKIRDATEEKEEETYERSST